MSRRSVPIHDGDNADTPVAEALVVEPTASGSSEAEGPAADAAPTATPVPAIDPQLLALASENDRLRKALDEKDALLQRYIAAHKKAEAEFAKVRGRLEADLDRRVERARGELVAKLFPVLDDLVRSLESAGKTPNFDALVQGVDMVYKAFQTRLEELGVERYSPQGQVFDPGLHEAMGVLPAPTPEQNNTVLHVYSPGYRAGDQVLRPARVIVGKFGG